MPLLLESDNVSGIVDENISIPIRINAISPYKIRAFGFRFWFENEALEFIETQKGDLTADWDTVGAFEDKIGHVTVGGYPGMASEIQDIQTGILCILRFRIVREIKTPIKIYELVDDLTQFKPLPLIIVVNQDVTMEANWYPATAPEWKENMSFSNLKTMINMLQEEGWKQSEPTLQEQAEYFSNARCPHGDKVIGRMLISPQNVRYPIAVCVDDKHQDVLVPFLPYFMGAGSRRNYVFVG